MKSDPHRFILYPKRALVEDHRLTLIFQLIYVIYFIVDYKSLGLKFPSEASPKSQVFVLACAVSVYLFVFFNVFSFWFEVIEFESDYFWKLNKKEVVSYSSISKVVLVRENVWTDFRRINSLQEFRIDFFGKDDDLVYSVSLFQEGDDIIDFLSNIFFKHKIDFHFTENKLEPKIHWEFIRIQYLLILCLAVLFVYSMN
jgi:hypothetical protein